MGLSVAVAQVFNLIYLVLFITILFTWIPSIKWYNEPFKSLRQFSEIFFAPFRKIIPPIGMIDISPFAAFIALSLLQKILVGLLVSLGL